MKCLEKRSHPLSVITHKERSLSGVLIVFVLPPDVFDLSLSDCCLQENEDTTTENGINPELAKVVHMYTFEQNTFLMVFPMGNRNGRKEAMR